jgi:multicomponent K+:H+ antiporter subunit D
MSHWIIAPVLLPAMLAPIIAMTMRHDMVLQRVFSLAGTVALLAIALGLAWTAADGTIRIYELGDWPAPFGIVLVLDRLAAMMLVLTGLLALAVQLYAVGSGWDRKGWHFHTLFQFQLMGVNGAFLTGDVFNLFVFFEVLLIASYGLMIHGGTAPRLRAGVQYVVMNLAGSTLFLFALGTIYATTGTLNMADLALKVRETAPGDEALVLVAGTLLLIVFAVKAAAFPVQFWLPGTYANAPAPVAALFAIMTKVGIYAIIRVYTLIFGPEHGPEHGLYAEMLLPAALATLIVGALGVLGARSLQRLVAFSVLASMGTLLIAVALFTPEGLTAALFYMIHSTFAAAALFLVSDLVARAQGGTGRAPGGLVASMYFAAAIAMAGMPPLSGFLGKLMVLTAAGPTPWGTLIWTVILVCSLITILGFVRLGSAIFWKPTATPAAEPPEPLSGLAVTAAFGPLAMLALLTLAAGPVSETMAETAAQLRDTGAYIAAVLGTGPEG